MGFAGAIGATIGAVSAGVGLLRQRNANRADNAALQASQQQQAMQQSIAQQQLTQQQQLSAIRDSVARQDVENRRQTLLAGLRPVDKAPPGVLKGLDTIYTSPLGDTSEPNYGKMKLLGN